MHNRLVVALSFSLALGACNDDFLTTVPPDQVSEPSFWRTEQDAVLGTNAIYPSLYGLDVIYFDNASDNGWQAQGFGGWYTIGNGNLDANSGTTSAFWRDSYIAIRRVNDVLANIDRIPVGDDGSGPLLGSDLKERLKGEVRFLRGYHYATLAITEGQVARTPAAQVVDQVLADLDFAAGVLPKSYSAADQGRATKGAALALKARAALYASRWQLAADAAQAVMGLSVYDLYPNYRDLFTYKGEGSAEVIFDEQFIQNQKAHNAFRELGPGSLGGGSRSVPLRSLVDDYYMRDGLPITQSPLYKSHPDSMHLNRDPRLYGTLLYPGATFLGKIYNSYPDTANHTADFARKDFDATATGYQQLKYVDEADYPGITNSGINMIIIRYADVLLMYAEAKIELGQTDATVTDAINLVRRRAGMPDIASGLSQTELRDVVRHERRVELALEGLRLFDIRRWRIAAQVMVGMTHGIDYIDYRDQLQKTLDGEPRSFNQGRDYLWPIPAREVTLNPNLTQNPGY
jgi:starch-binding outer membrane protein, SusD/RagB family